MDLPKGIGRMEQVYRGHAVTLKRQYQLWSELLPTPHAIADVHLICTDGIVPAHAVILQFYSPLFANLFKQLGDRYEGVRKIMMPDFNVAVINNFIQLIYKGSTKPLGRIETGFLHDVLRVLVIDHKRIQIHDAVDTADVPSSTPKYIPPVQKQNILTPPTMKLEVPGSSLQSIAASLGSLALAQIVASPSAGSGCSSSIVSAPNPGYRKYRLKQVGRVRRRGSGLKPIVAAPTPGSGLKEIAATPSPGSNSTQVTIEKQKSLSDDNGLTHERTKRVNQSSPSEFESLAVTPAETRCLDNNISQPKVLLHKLQPDNSKVETTLSIPSAEAVEPPAGSVKSINASDVETRQSQPPARSLRPRNALKKVIGLNKSGSKPSPGPSNGKTNQQNGIDKTPGDNDSSPSSESDSSDSKNSDVDFQYKPRSRSSGQMDKEIIIIDSESSDVEVELEVISPKSKMVRKQQTSRGKSVPKVYGKATPAPTVTVEEKSDSPEEVAAAKSLALNSVARYEDRELFLEDAKLCGKCKTKYTCVLNAENCVKGHGLLRCQFCFALFHSSKELLVHFTELHESKCSLCRDTIDFTTAAKHAMSCICSYAFGPKKKESNLRFNLTKHTIVKKVIPPIPIPQETNELSDFQILVNQDDEPTAGTSSEFMVPNLSGSDTSCPIQENLVLVEPKREIVVPLADESEEFYVENPEVWN